MYSFETQLHVIVYSKFGGEVVVFTARFCWFIILQSTGLLGVFLNIPVTRCPNLFNYPLSGVALGGVYTVSIRQSVEETIIIYILY